MAERAKTRWQPDPEVDRWRREDARWRREADATGRAWRAGMTLGEAMELLAGEPVVCACVGPPFCCRYAWDQARALVRAAHIAVKLFADHARTLRP